MNDYRKITALLKPYKGRIFGIFALNVFAVFFSIFSITMLAPFLALIFNPENRVTEAPEWSFSSDSLISGLQYLLGCIVQERGAAAALAITIAFICVLFLLKNLFTYLSMLCAVPMRTRIQKDLRDQCFRFFLTAPLSFYAQARKGDVMSRAINDIQEIDTSILQYVQQLFKEILTLLLFFAMLLFINWQFTLFVLISIPLAALLISWVQRRLKRHAITAKQAEGRMLSLTEESIYGLRIIKAFNNIPLQNEHFRQENGRYTRLLIRINRLKDLSSPLSDFIGMCMVVILLIAGSFLVANDSSFQAEVFITYLVLFTQIINPMKTIADAAANFKKGFASMQRIEELLQQPTEASGEGETAEMPRFEQEIRIEEADFAYEGKTVLHQLSLCIPKGKHIGLCGSSGSGKSTLADLLPRFYELRSGRISIDGTDIRELPLDGLRQLFSIVSQESILFNDTIFNNIAFGKPNTGEEEVWAAAEAAQIAGFIRSLPDGMQTEVGDRGLKLSGGQRQRISIARAFLKDAPVLILDEATSALDSESEKQLQAAIQRLMRGKTTLTIAHRLSTLFEADEIVVLENGRIVEKGSHQSLVQQQGAYFRMLQLQALE
ncbi:MAG: ABC transporter ATP-binding protein [Bacteroidales bacterium]|nr:ABC transporter ATP-binding protein [Bacteroidales bacterium]